MNKRRRYRAVLVLGTVGLLLTVACGLWLRSYQRQEALNRQLIATVLNNDSRQAISLVNAGADPNTLFVPLPAPSMGQWMREMRGLPQLQEPLEKNARAHSACRSWELRSSRQDKRRGSPAF